MLFVGSGGLSHDPPVPTLEGAAPEVAAQLISEGRHLTPEQRAARQLRVIQAGRDYAAGVSTMQPLNPEWDRNLLAVLASGDLEQIDAWSTDWFTEQAGHSAHETRTSIAAYAALAAAGPYTGHRLVLRTHPGLDRRVRRHHRPAGLRLTGITISAARPGAQGS